MAVGANGSREVVSGCDAALELYDSPGVVGEVGHSRAGAGPRPAWSCEPPNALGAEVTFNEHDLIAGDFGMQVELALQAAGGPIHTQDEIRGMFFNEGPVEGGAQLRNGTTPEAEPGDRRGEMDPDGSESDR